MIQSIKAGRIVDIPSLETLSDGTAGGLEPGSITFELCRDLVDETVAVGEEAIRDTLGTFLRTHHMLIEGAAAVALAALLEAGDRVAGRRVVVVLCGANIDPGDPEDRALALLDRGLQWFRASFPEKTGRQGIENRDGWACRHPLSSWQDKSIPRSGHSSPAGKRRRLTDEDSQDGPGRHAGTGRRGLRGHQEDEDAGRRQAGGAPVVSRPSRR